MVNNERSVARATLRRFRALLPQVETSGPTGKKRGPGDDVLASMAGFAKDVDMVTPAKGRGLKRKVRALMSKYT